MSKPPLSFCVAVGLLLTFVPSRTKAGSVTATSGAISTAENSSLDFFISSLVTSTDPITGYTVALGPYNGSLVPATIGEFIYTPSAYYFGSDSFVFTATDSLGDVSNPATVDITVNEAHLPPLVSNGIFDTTVNTPLFINLSSLTTPTNGVPIQSYAVSNPSDGTIPFFDASGGTFFYDPNTGFVGTDQFFWTATTGQNIQAEALVLITVVPSSVSSVPEPGTLFLFSSGLACVCAWRRRMLLKGRLGARSCSPKSCGTGSKVFNLFIDSLREQERQTPQVR